MLSLALPPIEGLRNWNVDEKEKESYLGETDRLFPWCKVRIYVIYVQRSGISELQASLGRALSPPRKGRGMGPGAPYIDP